MTLLELSQNTMTVCLLVDALPPHIWPSLANCFVDEFLLNSSTKHWSLDIQQNDIDIMTNVVQKMILKLTVSSDSRASKLQQNSSLQLRDRAKSFHCMYQRSYVVVFPCLALWYYFILHSTQSHWPLQFFVILYWWGFVPLLPYLFLFYDNLVFKRSPLTSL